jgi:hypothetical protein
MSRPFSAVIPRNKRSLHNFGTKLETGLLAYATVAAAAGVSILAASQPASAEIVYRQVNIHVNGLRTIDINNDGIKDFIFGMNSTSRYGARFLFVQHAHPIDSIAVTSGSNPVPLHRGTKSGLRAASSAAAGASSWLSALSIVRRHRAGRAIPGFTALLSWGCGSR